MADDSGGKNQGWFQGPPILGPPYGKLPTLFPYHSHIFRDSYESGMGIVWERGPNIRGPWKFHWKNTVIFHGKHWHLWLRYTNPSCVLFCDEEKLNTWNSCQLKRTTGREHSCCNRFCISSWINLDGLKCRQLHRFAGSNFPYATEIVKKLNEVGNKWDGQGNSWRGFCIESWTQTAKRSISYTPLKINIT